MERKYTPGPWQVVNGSDVFTGLGARNAAVRRYLAQCPPHAGDTTGTEHGRMMDAAGAALLKAGHDL